MGCTPTIPVAVGPDSVTTLPKVAYRMSSMMTNGYKLPTQLGVIQLLQPLWPQVGEAAAATTPAYAPMAAGICFAVGWML